MIQVEKEIKFSPEPDKLQSLVSAEHQHIQNRDVYCGFPTVQGVEYPLIRQNAWLRRRNDEYELKIVQESNRNGGLKISKEVPRDHVEDTLDDLLGNYDVDPVGLESPSLQPLVYVATDRRRYVENGETAGVDEFYVDIDKVRFWQELKNGWREPGEPDMTWEVGEIDITASGEDAAKKEIDRLVTTQGLDVHRKRKVVTYLREKGSDTYGYIPES